MRYFSLIWAMLWRSKTRTVLTFLSIVVAFLLFGVLNAVESALFSGVRLSGDDHLIVTYRQGLTKLLPASYLHLIDKVEGVRAAQLIYPMGGFFQDPKNRVNAIAIDADPRAARNVEPRLLILPAQLKKFVDIRTAAIAGRELMEKNGWKVGDSISVSGMPRKKDGSQSWVFDLVGQAAYDEKLTGHKERADFMLVRYDYVDAAIEWPGHVGWYLVSVKDPKRAGAVADAIDQLFLSSEFPTKTEPEKEFQSGLLQQVGDVGAVISSVMAAVFFTLIMVTGNSMMQSFRERISELGVLKSIGFTDGQLAMLIVAESLILTLGAGSLGLWIAIALIQPLGKAALDSLPVTELDGTIVLVGCFLAAGLGTLAALIPAWKSARLTVIEALATTE